MHIFAMATIAAGSVVPENVPLQLLILYVAKLYFHLKWEKVKKVHQLQVAHFESETIAAPERYRPTLTVRCVEWFGE